VRRTDQAWCIRPDSVPAVVAAAAAAVVAHPEWASLAAAIHPDGTCLRRARRTDRVSCTRPGSDPEAVAAAVAVAVAVARLE
jgi:hypothetical protein